MNRAELIKFFQEKNIPIDSYSMMGGLPNEAFCINKIDKGWEVYYSERGVKSQLSCFDNEEDACMYLKDKLGSIIGFE